MLTVSELSVQFKGLRALDDVSFTVHKGEILGIIGPNGAGKTTLFNAITGFVQLNHGEVWFNDTSLKRLSPEQICRLGVARTFQVAQPFGGLTVLDNVVVGALATRHRVRDARVRAEEVLSAVGLERFASAPARGLPVALRKRLELARAIATDCSLLFMDEVMGGLNPSEVQGALQLVRSLRDQGITIVIIEHNMAALMSLVDRVLAFSFGKLLAVGTPSDITQNTEVIAAYLGRSHGAA